MRGPHILALAALIALAGAQPGSADAEKRTDRRAAARAAVDKRAQSVDRAALYKLTAPLASALAAPVRAAIGFTDSLYSMADVPAAVPRAVTPRGAKSIVDMPVRGTMTSNFGPRRDPMHHRVKVHKGVDFSAKRGTPVFTAGTGRVIEAKVMRGYGRIVIVDHGSGYTTRYAHLQRIQVRKGQRLVRGARVGTVGSSGRATGPHLHFEVRVKGQAISPASVLPVKRPPPLIVQFADALMAKKSKAKKRRAKRAKKKRKKRRARSKRPQS